MYYLDIFAQLLMCFDWLPSLSATYCGNNGPIQKDYSKHLGIQQIVLAKLINCTGQ